MKTIRLSIIRSLFVLLAGAAPPIWGQSQSLPVYLVTQTGAQPAQAAALASYLGIPSNRVSVVNGRISFLDPTNYLAVPSLPVTNAAVIGTLLAQTINKAPGIPLRFSQPDFAGINALVPYGSNAAVALSGAALDSAGLAPQYGSPSVSHDLFMARYTNDNLTVLSSSNALDTEVDYQFVVPGGYPLIGPGAQVQFNFGPNGGATRLLYAARQLSPGPMVSIISSATASNRAAALYPGLAPQITPQLVYYAPSLSITSVTALIPWYLCRGTGTLSNSLSGALTPTTLQPALIPATDDPAYVPSLYLTARLANGGTIVSATADVTGGSPPYTLSWAGSDPATATNTALSLSYTPQVRITPPRLFSWPGPSPHALTLSWFDPAQFFVLQSASNLSSGTWSGVTNSVSDHQGQMSVALDQVGADAGFFRLAISNSALPQPETVSAFVTDRNGVTVGARQTFSIALAQLTPVKVNFGPGPGWGVESPWDPGLGTKDRLDWTTGMNLGIFGQRDYYVFGYAAAAFDFQSCLNDNQNGDYDSTVGTADILLYIGHGNPDAISFTSPWTPPALFWQEDYQAWGNNGVTCHDFQPGQSQEWLCLLSCNVLLFAPTNDFNVVDRWLPSFNGLHLLLGFSSEAEAMTGFPQVFAGNMVSGPPAPSIYQAWFDAAKACHTGQAAVLAPLGPNAVWDIADCWWWEGPVGPTLLPSQFKGWYYVVQSP